MKLSDLIKETVTTAAIAIPMVPLDNKNKKKKKKTISDSKSYLGIGGSDKPKNSIETVWQPFKSKKVQRWYNQYAGPKINQDERLLANHRGKGY